MSKKQNGKSKTAPAVMIAIRVPKSLLARVQRQRSKDGRGATRTSAMLGALDRGLVK